MGKDGTGKDGTGKDGRGKESQKGSRGNSERRRGEETLYKMRQINQRIGNNGAETKKLKIEKVC